MRPFTGAALLLSLLSSVQSLNSTSVAATSIAAATPSCLQPRPASDPASTSILTALKGAIQNACDSSQQQAVTSSSLSLAYYKFGSIFFNISSPINVAQQHAASSFCFDSFNTLVTACIDAPNPGFWGGWIVSSGNNYSISDSVYPANPLPSAVISSSLAASSSGSAAQRSAGPSVGFSSPSSLLLGTGAQTSSTISSNAPPYPIRSQQSGSGTAGFVVAPNGTTVSATSSAVRTVASQLTGTGILPSMPLPSLGTIITGTAGSRVVTETFVPHIFAQYSTISGTITTTITLAAGASPVTVVVGPGGVGWAPYQEPSGTPELLPPSVLPPSAVAALDSENPTTAGVRSASVPLITGDSSRSLPLGVGINVSSSSITQSSRRSPIGVGITSSSVPPGTDVSASSNPSSRSSLGNESIGSSVSSSSTGTSGSVGKTTQSASVTSTAAPGSSSYSAIYPISSVTTAFNNPLQSITTLSVSGAAIVYYKQTIPGLSTITAPTTIQSSVVETDQAGKTSTFIGGIVVGPGGVYWGPPGLPPIPSFPGIAPPCIWPFCTGGGGGGGSNPPGKPDPQPPHTPDHPKTPDGNDRKTQDPSNQSEQSFSTRGSSSSLERSSSSKSSASSSSSSSTSTSCSSSTVTDYWVSCAGGASSACSTYSSSLISGCSVSATISTTTSACPLGAQVTADPTFAGFDYSNGEYPVLRVGYSDTVQWTYTVAEIVASGVVVGGAAGASSGPRSSATSSLTATTNQPTSRSRPTRGGTTNMPSVTGEPLCVPFADPDHGVANVCQCSSGTAFTTLSVLTGSSNQCGYTSFPSPSPTPSPSSKSNLYPFTYTDPMSGPIVACKRFSLGNAGGIKYTVCEGDRTTAGTDSSIHDHYTSATAAAAAASRRPAAAAASASATAVPAADCAFWDEGLYWTFEVYNINGWAGDNGDGLHKQENGCGNLTGWSWSTGDQQHAYFNLPFLMKSGCVERAIASAGGPSGLSCNGEGLGMRRRALRLGLEKFTAKRRFRTDVALSLRERSIFEDPQALRKAKRETFSELKSPSISELDVGFNPKRIDARAEFEKLYALDSRDLVKRGCLDWLWPSTNIPKEWWCNCVIPGVDACAQAIQKKGAVGRFPSLFYTSWGGIGKTNNLGVEGTKLWAQQNICGRFVDFDGIVTSGYMFTTESAIEKPFGKKGLNLKDEEVKKIIDPFLKNLSQAFAELSAGETYVIVPKGVGFRDTSAWTGWEYPALTRNKKITKIWKVELDASDPSQFVPGRYPPSEKTLLWTPDMGPSAIAPKGVRHGTLPAQIPEDQIPPNWQDSI